MKSNELVLPVSFVLVSIPCANNGTIGECVSGLYNWSLAIVGVVAFVQIIYAGFLYLTAAGNTSKTGDAMSKISNAVLGIVLLFSSYLILNTINPDLVGGGINLPNLKDDPVQKVDYNNPPNNLPENLPENPSANPPSTWSEEKTAFTFTNLGSGAYQKNGLFYIEDFAIVVNYFGSGIAKVGVTLTDDQGLNYTFTEDNLGAPLIIGEGTKKTVLLNVATNAFPMTDTQYEYHPNITVQITADKPVRALPPNQFAVAGSGKTIAEAVTKNWERFGFNPPGTTVGNPLYQSYAIFWRNVPAFPNGWDTKFFLKNNANQSVPVVMQYLPDYFKRMAKSDCSETYPSVGPKNILLSPGETRVLTLSNYLGLTLQDSATTEGAVAFEFPNNNSGSVAVQETVVPLLSGGIPCGTN